MAQRYWVYYDEATFGAAAAMHNLFQTSQGSSSTRTESKTNSPGSGVLPQNFVFELHRISVFPDVNMSAADRENMWLQSYLKIEVNNQEVFKAPLRMIAGYAGYQGLYTQAAAADEALIGANGDGFELPVPITIKGGDGFRVDVYQGTATAATQYVKVALEGLLTTPN